MPTSRAPTGPQPSLEALNIPPHPSMNSASPELKSSKFDLAISLALSTWPCLTLAVQNFWGGADSASKRDWLAGAISTLFESEPLTDEDDVCDVLLQVMCDEFDVAVDDGSEEEVARSICGFRRSCERGEFAAVDDLFAKWVEREGRGERISMVDGGEMEVDGGESGEEWTEDENYVIGGKDVEMEDAPTLVPERKKVIPEVDQEGFTKVSSKKKR